MPYEIVKINNGYKVKKQQLGRQVYFSKHSLDYETALRQLRALYYNENKNKIKIK